MINKQLEKLRVESLKEIPNMKFNNPHRRGTENDLDLHTLMKLQIELNQYKEHRDELKEVSQFVLSKIKKKLEERGLVMFDVKLMDEVSNGECRRKDERFIVYVPREVCVSEGVLTKYLCILFRECKGSYNDFGGDFVYDGMNWNDVRIEINNPLKDNDVKKLIKNQKFIWVKPSSLKEMVGFNNWSYDSQLEFPMEVDKKSMIESFQNLKFFVSENFMRTPSHNRYRGMKDDDWKNFLEIELGIKSETNNKNNSEVK